MRNNILFAFVLMAMLCSSLGIKAQSDATMAILQTGDEVKVFNGVDALKNAYNEAAATGSTITLSEGIFNSPGNIKKAVDIYGVGFEGDAQNGVNQPTVINSAISFLTGSDEQSLKNFKIEGVYIKGAINIQQTSELLINKCRFLNLYFSGNNAQSITIKQSVIERSIEGSNEIRGLDIENCYIGYRFLASHPDNQVLFNHCILPTGSEGGHAKATYTNCIFNGLYRAGIAANSVVKNCILKDISVSDCMTENNWTTNGADIFDDGGYPENYYGCFYDSNRTYKLKDPETYVGTDGTEVGICGGLGWKKVVTTPVVKDLQLSVSGKTLKVNYEAKTR